MPQKPNFILMVADDMGWDDLALHGNPVIETPNLDKLGQESVRFERFYVNPVCAPTRASLLTGRHFLRTGVSHVHGGKDFLALDEVTIADALKKGGYHTGMWGKWHSGKTEGYFPWQRGFDTAFMADLYKHENSSGELNGERVEHQKWTTAVLMDYALDFIETHQNEPFFAYLPFLSCHAPLKAEDSQTQKYIQKGISQPLATIYAMIGRIDWEVGRLLGRLQELNIAKNTVIIFLSDNGPAVLNADLTDQDRETRYVNELRGHKGNIWENGVRSPLFVHWPGHLKPAVVTRLTDVCDLYPTLLDLAAIENPHSRPIDGRSLKPYLFGKTDELPPKLSFNWANPAWPPTDQPWRPEGIRDEYRPITPDQKENMDYRDQILSVQNETHKLLLNPGTIDHIPECAENGLCLYNMVTDPTQRNCVVGEHPRMVESLRASLADWWQSVLEEENSFNMPVFLVGGKKSTLLAYAPYDSSPDVKSAFNYSYHWTKAGDFAVYRIQVKESGKYHTSLHYIASAPKNALVKLSSEPNSVVGHITHSSRAYLGELHLNKGDQLLTLKLLDAGQSQLSVFDKLYTIELQKGE
jgi:arylsulfatase A-like enzyme